MCEIFSCLVTQAGKGYYDNKEHSHWKVQEQFVDKDPLLMDDKMPPTFVRVELLPDNGRILFPDEWFLEIDEREAPRWFKERHEQKAWSMHEEWLKWLHEHIDVTKIPENLFLQKPDLSKLKEPEGIMPNNLWEIIDDSVGMDVRMAASREWHPTFGDVVDAVLNDWHYNNRQPSMFSDGWHQAWGSVRHAVTMRIGYMFLKCSLWKEGKYLGQDFVDLWQAGILPVQYEEKWHYFVSPKGDGRCEEVK